MIFVPRGCKVHLTLYLPTSCRQEHQDCVRVRVSSTSLPVTAGPCFSQQHPGENKGSSKSFVSNRSYKPKYYKVFTGGAFRDVLPGSHCKHSLRTVHGSIPRAEERGSCFLSDKYKGRESKDTNTSQPLPPHSAEGQGPSTEGLPATDTKCH